LVGIFCSICVTTVSLAYFIAYYLSVSIGATWAVSLYSYTRYSFPLVFFLAFIIASFNIQFKKIFYEREHVGKKELEELVSPFYRTGPLSQFDQLLEILRIEYERGTIKAIVQHVPRPIKTQMRERLYAGV